MFQHLALIKKGLRRDKRGCICFKKAFQHLALIKKGLRHLVDLLQSLTCPFSTLP